MQFQSSVHVKKAVICPAFGSSHCSDNEKTPDLALADSDKFNKMPLLGSGMHPGRFVVGCNSEHGVRDD